jgi:hypothetical protein
MMRIFERASRAVSQIARIGQSEKSRNVDRGWKWLKQVEKGFAEKAEEESERIRSM